MRHYFRIVLWVEGIISLLSAKTGLIVGAIAALETSSYDWWRAGLIGGLISVSVGNTLLLVFFPLIAEMFKQQPRRH